eukprot:1155364-Pelagomonas_calceolata.AAC.6
MEAQYVLEQALQSNALHSSVRQPENKRRLRLDWKWLKLMLCGEKTTRGLRLIQVLYLLS